MNNQYKVFVSYYHEEDHIYIDQFAAMFANVHGILLSKSSAMGKFDTTKFSTERIRQAIRDKYLQETTVTVVLIGANTWKQKSVDWEISASLHQTQYNTRSGLLGILLPTHPGPPDRPYDPYTVPPRLYDNVRCGFAKIYPWNDHPHNLLLWIHYAYRQRTEVLPDNSRAPLLGDLLGNRWQ